MRAKRRILEQQLAEKEGWWDLLDKDFQYRTKAIEALEGELRNLDSMEPLLRNLVENEYIRAWVITKRGWTA